MTQVTTTDRIRSSVGRNGLTWGDVSQRVAEENALTYNEAARLVDRLERRDDCPVMVAAAIISLVSEISVKRAEMLARGGDW